MAEAIECVYFGLPSRSEPRGLSAEADEVQQKLNSIRTSGSPSIFFEYPFLQGRKRLLEAYQEAAVENWDGYGAHAASPLDLQVAKRFLACLPCRLPVPDISVDPDGEFCFDWEIDASHTFSVSVGRRQVLSYAGMNGQSVMHGEDFFGDQLSEEVLRCIDRLYQKEVRDRGSYWRPPR